MKQKQKSAAGARVGMNKAIQSPVFMNGHSKRGLRTQFGALCFRVVNDKTEVLLITSRRSGRWIIPKGWPMDEKTPARAASREAYQEAGIKGKSYQTCLGGYSYVKILDPTDVLPIMVLVYPIKVKTIVQDYPEAKQRKRKWFSLKKAAKKISDPEMGAIIRRFDPKLLTY
ncbi:NUDIX hydrolase [Algirhabdus cladophorae]|uniref:NUDIX hydrolase n=1 Tax=Algirhabdus cladophorae TaxID=3377108 RepID=UPI003B847741